MGLWNPSCFPVDSDDKFFSIDLECCGSKMPQIVAKYICMMLSRYLQGGEPKFSKVLTL